MRRGPLLLSMMLLSLLWPDIAWAHAEPAAALGVLAGLRHPLSGLDHVLAMVAVGFWGAQLGMPAVWLLPVCFPLVMACGGMLGLMGVALPCVEIAIPASAIALGTAILASWRPPLWVAALLVAFFAVFHGHAHGVELPAGGHALLYSAGFVVATGILHLTGVGVGVIHRWRWGRWALRVAGASVASAGTWFLWRALT